MALRCWLFGHDIVQEEVTIHGMRTGCYDVYCRRCGEQNL
jgi:hypothetical protein